MPWQPSFFLDVNMMIREALMAASLVIWTGACMTSAHTQKCPHRYTHSCDIWYQTEGRVSCEKDPKSQECRHYKSVIKAREEAAYQGQCYGHETCLRGSE